jgi:cyclopropane-fatty-acyl-phospholipid synthase
MFYGAWWGALWYRLRHLLRRNSRAGSAKNIHAHYDLGNAFYKLWLDPGMSYSAAWFEGRDPAEVPLEQAQHAKMRRALRQAGVTPGSRVLEIGCGWGGLAELAAREFGAGLATQARLLFSDYRDLPRQHAAAPFDAIVSIEMFEAVGHEYWGEYFDVLRRCLKPGGRACIQTITIRDDLFDRYLRSTDFIQQYIVPGGLLPSAAEFERAARQAGFEIEHRLAFGPDYAETLRRWRAEFLRRKAEVQLQGFDERFQRIWEFYLGYCEAAFDTGSTDVIQFTLKKPL